MDVETSEAIERLGQRMDAVESSLRNEFRADIRILAEGFATPTAKRDSGR